MKSPTQIVWDAHGSPAVDGCEDAPGRCYVCSGERSRGMVVTKWLGSNYTDQNRARNPTASHVCEACVYVHSRTSPVLGRPPKEGKKFGGNFRNYSHCWEDGSGYFNASKGEKPLLREFLAREHGGSWFAAIADSGQKHVLPFAPMNGPGRGGRVQFEEELVPVPESLELVDVMSTLLTEGCTKDEIQIGDYSARAWRLCGEALRAFEPHPERGSAWFRLAIWLAQRDEEKVAARIAAEKEQKCLRKQKHKKGQTGDLFAVLKGNTK